MRLFFSVIGMMAALSGGFAQGLEYAAAPQEFLGYAFGAQETAVAEALTAAGTPFRQEAVRAGQTLTKLVLTNQTLDKLDRATVELQFYRGSLYLISATVPYAADSLQALRNVLTAKYGAVKSNERPELPTSGAEHRSVDQSNQTSPGRPSGPVRFRATSPNAPSGVANTSRSTNAASPERKVSTVTSKKLI